MKNILITLLTFFSLSTASAQKVGYTNVELILSSLSETKNVQRQIDTYTQQLQSSIQVKQKNYQAKLQEYQTKKQANSMPPTDEQNLINTIQKLEKEIQQEVADAEVKIQQKRNKLLTPITNQIQEAINSVAKENGYTYILNQTSGMNILYGMETYDVTEEIAKKLGVDFPE